MNDIDKRIRSELERLAPGGESVIPIEPGAMGGQLVDGEPVRIGSPEYQDLLREVAQQQSRSADSRIGLSRRRPEFDAISTQPSLAAVAHVGSVWGPRRRMMSTAAFRDAVVENYRRQTGSDVGYLEHCFDSGRLGADFAARWFNSGLPRVVVAHRHAAALMSTDIEPDVADDVPLPWEALVVDVPTGMLSYSHQDGVPRELRHYLVWRHGGQVVADIFPRRLSHTDEGPFGVNFHPEPVELHLRMCLNAAATLEDPRARMNARSGVVGMRFLIGVIYELTEHRPALVHAAGPRDAKRSFRGEPVTTTFQLVRNVRVDCRQAVRDYCRGIKRSAPTVQHLVRGHWKHQAFGADRIERKRIFVEPYWRGPDDAPIALRSHVLGKETQP